MAGMSSVVDLLILGRNLATLSLGVERAALQVVYSRLAEGDRWCVSRGHEIGIRRRLDSNSFRCA